MFEEMESVALEGVWKASQTFEVGRGSWVAYAMWKGRLACFDYLRDHGQTRRNGRQRYPDTNYFTDRRWGPPDPEARREWLTEEWHIPSRYLRGLSRTEKELLRMRFEQERTMKDIGDLLGLSESRVSQVFKELLPRIRLRVELLV